MLIYTLHVHINILTVYYSLLQFTIYLNQNLFTTVYNIPTQGLLTYLVTRQQGIDLVLDMLGFWAEDEDT